MNVPAAQAVNQPGRISRIWKTTKRIALIRINEPPARNSKADEVILGIFAAIGGLVGGLGAFVTFLA
jgi:hypothetical protein